MKRPRHTLILLPHGRAGSREFRFTTRQVATAVAVLIALLGVATWSAGSLAGRPHQPSELESIREENTALRHINASFESSVEELETRLAAFEERTQQLAIVAGIQTVATEPGVGGELDLPLDSTADGALVSLEARTEQLAAALESISEGLGEQLEWIASAPTLMPVKGVITSGFGQRRDPFHGRMANHPALDIGAASGRPVVAPGDGVVVRAGRLGNLGNAVVVSHGFGITTRFGHLSRIDVDAGQRVHRGDVIGRVGRTGRATGNHLHYEVHVDRVPVNPLEYMLDR